MFEVSYFYALIAGTLSFVSPCVLPLVPLYLTYLAGVSLKQLDDKGEFTKGIRARLVLSSAAFVLGFTIVFVMLGLSIGLIGEFLSEYQFIIGKILGVLIIIFGLHFLGIFRIGFLYKEARFETSNKSASPMVSFIMGLAFAFGWTPCVGPILASILAIASSGGTTQGTILLLVYSIGIGIPFMLAAFFAPEFMGWLKKFRRHLSVVEKIIGVLLIFVGLLFLNNTNWIPFMISINDISIWIQQTFPGLIQVEGLVD